MLYLSIGALVLYMAFAVVLVRMYYVHIKPEEQNMAMGKRPFYNYEPQAKANREVWSFVDGVKVVDGRKVPLTRSQTYMSSNGTTIYTRCWWSDGTQSCNCPGWVNEKKDKVTKEKLPRTCGHVKGEKEDCRVEGPVVGSFKMQPTNGVIEVGRRIIGREE